ncbi:MAG TPA: hypothetical protein VEC14_06165 [Reyranellaceae bacterium]|nr:hypothetical protein [Reyranellaceae bacterium]
MVAAIATVAASVMSMVSSMQRASATDDLAAATAASAATAKQIGDYNAALAEREGEQARAQAAYEEARVRERGQKLLAAQRAAAGKSGIVWTEGSSVLLNAEAVENTEMDALMIRHSGNLAAVQSEARAAQARFTAEAEASGLINRSSSLRAEAGAQRTSGVASLLNGASNAYSIYNRGGTQVPTK